MRRYLALASLLALGACASFGSQQSTLAADCAMQAVALQQAAVLVRKLSAAERATIDAQRDLSKPYCSGVLPADQVAASKVVQQATARIGAVVGLASAR